MAALIPGGVESPDSSQNDPEHLYEALDFVARGKVKVISETYSLTTVDSAVRI